MFGQFGEPAILSIVSYTYWMIYYENVW